MQVTIVPVFMLIRGMNLADTLLALILPAIPTAFGTFLMRQYFLGLPAELGEAAEIDGAGPWRIFASIYAPLAVPGMAIVGILAFNFHWNEFFRPLIMTISEQNFTLPLGLVSLQGQYGHRFGGHRPGGRGTFDDPGLSRVRLRAADAARGPDRRLAPLRGAAL